MALLGDEALQGFAGPLGLSSQLGGFGSPYRPGRLAPPATSPSRGRATFLTEDAPLHSFGRLPMATEPPASFVAESVCSPLDNPMESPTDTTPAVRRPGRFPPGSEAAACSPSAPPQPYAPTAGSPAATHDSFSVNAGPRHGGGGGGGFGSFETADGDRHDLGGVSSRGGGRWGGAVAPASSSFVPPGMDSASFIAGERAALIRAFRETLPSQQALGSLFNAVEQLQARANGEGGHLRTLQATAAELSAHVKAVAERVDALESRRLPELQHRIDGAAARPLSQEFQETLKVLQTVLSVRHTYSPEGGEPAGLASVGRQLRWVLALAGGYAESAISKADVAAVFLSRKILLADWQPGGGAISSGARTAAGSALFLLAVESAWIVQQRMRRLVPAPLNQMTSPLHAGLKWARVAVWAAALTLTAVRVRRWCHAAAEAGLQSSLWHISGAPDKADPDALDDNGVPTELSQQDW